jgi:hypothetical protein
MRDPVVVASMNAAREIIRTTKLATIGCTKNMICSAPAKIICRSLRMTTVRCFSGRSSSYSRNRNAITDPDVSVTIFTWAKETGITTAHHVGY